MRGRGGLRACMCVRPLENLENFNTFRAFPCTLRTRERESTKDQGRSTVSECTVCMCTVRVRERKAAGGESGSVRNVTTPRAIEHRGTYSFISAPETRLSPGHTPV